MIGPTEAFWSKVLIGDGCWEWQGPRSRYGRFGAERAHRVSWELSNGREVPEGRLVRHTCDNPICVRPSHLLIGTPADNARDKVERGRQFKKLSDDGVREVLRSSDSSRVIAARLGVSSALVRSIRIGRRRQAVASGGAN